MVISFLRGNLSTITDVIFFLWNRHGRHNDDNTLHHMSIHTNTSIHINTHRNTQHRHTTQPSTFSFQHRYRPTSFQVARGLHRNPLTTVSCMMRTCPPGREWAKAHALWPSRQVRTVCTERASWTSDHSLLLRSVVEREDEERDEKHGQKERRMRGERRMGGERDTRREGEMESEGATTFKTFPSVHSKRLFERTHGSVFHCKTRRNAQHTQHTVL